jgi:glutathione synthase/RimK-type ligase-like ATP-grasp enzyme
MSRIVILTPSEFMGGNNWLLPVFPSVAHLSFLGHIAARHPEAAARIEVVLHPNQPQQLEKCEVLVQLMPDPLERFPERHAWAADIERRAREHGAAVVNSVRVLARATVKSEMLARWREAGIPCPRARRVSSKRELLAFMEEIGGAVIVKGDDGQCLNANGLLENLDEARRFDFAAFQDKVEFENTNRSNRCLEDATPSRAVFAAEFVDTRGNDGLVRKARCIVMGDAVVRRHLYTSEKWVVRMPVWDGGEASKEAENRFLAQASTAEDEVCRRATRALGLDVAGIDFSWDKNGKPVLWEANPHYAISRRNLRPEEVANIQRHHDALLNYYTSLLRDAAAAVAAR